MRRSGPVLLLLLAACAHSEPFSGANNAPVDGPFHDAQPLQLTFNPRLDTWPSWAPDERQVYYGAEDPGPEFDVCLQALPIAGGTATPLACPLRIADDTTEILDNPVSDGSRLAWIRGTVRAGIPAAPFWSLWVRPLANGAAATRLQQFPETAPDGAVHDLPRFLQWLKPGVLLYLGTQSLGCCGADTLKVGQQAVLLDLTGATPVKTYIPGTERITAVSGSSDGLAIVFTRPGDSLVYRRVLASGLVDTLHNFGTGHVVRDPVLRGNTLAALLDGMIRLDTFPPFGESWVDKGGLLNLVDVGTGAATQVEDTKHFWRHLRLSADGNRILAEGYPYTLVTTQIGPGSFVTDTIVSALSDIWLWQ